MPVFFSLGCDTLKGPNQSYIVPAVEGRVVDARSGEPLEEARVQRYLGKNTQPDPLATKGAQRLLLVPTVNSDPQGQFRISPEKSGNLLLEPQPVYEITLVIRHATHQTLTTNINLIQIRPVRTNKVPVLQLGDVPLEPKSD